MAQKDLVEMLRQISDKRLSPEEWAQRRKTIARLDLSKADLSDLQLADLNLAKADLSNAILFNANLAGADLSDCALTFADLRRANLAGALLCGANLSGANLESANLVDTNLREALLQRTHLCGAYCVGAIFAGADLTDADLRGARCKFATFADATVRNVNVEGADLTHAEVGIEQWDGMVNLECAIVQLGKTVESRTKRKLSVSETYDDLFAEADCYTILGIQPGVSPDEIARAYRKRVKEYHPDRVAHLGAKLHEVARREFDRVQDAYRSLTRYLAKPYMDVGNDVLARVRSPEAISLEEYRDLAHRYPGNDRILYNLGVKYFEAGWIDKAIEALDKAVALNPGNESARYNLKIIRLLQELIA